MLISLCTFFWVTRSCNLLLADSQHDKLDSVAVECHKASGTADIAIETSLCDVTNKSDVENAIRKADEVASASASSPSPVASILVNCAGITRDAKCSNLSDEDWDEVLDVNLRGTFFTCRAFCEPRRLSALLGSTAAVGNGGSIINIGSIVSNYGNVGQVNYAASKGGVVGLTRALAKEMALLSSKSATTDDVIGNGMKGVPPAVRVNCIQPGFIHTPMAHAVPEKVLAEMTRRIALRRLGRAEDVANLALFLASSERSGYITGEALECSGMLRL